MRIMKRKMVYLLVGIVSTIIIGSSLGVGLYFGLNKSTKLFIAVHCEPGGFPYTSAYQEQYWPSLVAMMEQADNFDVKLNLLFNPQWGTYILSNISRLNLVRTWETNGHEIGLHVHGPQMATWCGYTNQLDYIDDPRYIGTIDDMMTLMNQLPESGRILTTCSATDEDIIYDYPTGVLYSTYGGSDKMAHLWSKPESLVFNDQSTQRVTHARYGAVQTEVNIDYTEFKELYQEKNVENIMGLVWHVFNFEDSPFGFIGLFEYLNVEGILTWKVSEIFGPLNN